MLFNSLAFLIFFIASSILYFLLPHRYRWFFLLAISCYFYMAFIPIYILILLFTILVDYAAGILIESVPRHKKALLLTSILVNAGVLCFFKYYNFFNENLTLLLDQFGIHNSMPFLKIILPLGLSFHTFQAMSYTIEVYRGNQKAERHLGIYALYVMFYPQLVAGPIERPQNMLHQFHQKMHFDYDRVSSGLKQMLWGLFMKVVIADRLSIYVDTVFKNPTHHGWISCATASIFFTFQIYCDFAGYSNIALGSAKVLGFRLMNNFDLPFFSRSITEYWRRWHISLSTWLNDYLFMPLATGTRDWGKWGIVFGLLVTFFVSGLWHGAGWTFVVFGLLHGVAVCYEFLTRKTRKKWFAKLPAWLNEGLSILLTFGFVTLALVFFRAPSMNIAVTMIKNIFSFKPGPLFIGFAPGFAYSIGTILFLIAAEINKKTLNNRYSLLYKDSYGVRLAGYTALLLIILMIGVFNGGQFIYFQF